VFELPIFILGLVRLGILVGEASPEPAGRLRRDGGGSRGAPWSRPGHDRVRMVPRILLFECSIWLSVAFERRWQTASLYDPDPHAL